MVRIAKQAGIKVMETSPMQRCRETARPLEQLWEQSAKVFEPVAELPSPPLDLKHDKSGSGSP
jgi:hypothetical protein